MQLSTLVLTLALLAPGVALAHGADLPIGPHDLWHHWTFDAVVLAPLLVGHWLYGRGVLRLWARAGHGRGIQPWQVASFAAGELVLAIALISPLDGLGETLLTAHMAQHGLLVAVAPPLLLLGRPGTAWAHALPRPWRRQLGRGAPGMALRLFRWLSRPGIAMLHHGAVLWLWHAPALFTAALENIWLHRLEHALFFATAMLFCAGLLRARSGAALAGALGAALFTLMHTGFLGAFLTLAHRPFYPFYEGRSELWGLSALEDQQLAGLLMWVPMGALYLGLGCAMAARLLGGAAEAEPIRPRGVGAT